MTKGPRKWEAAFLAALENTGTVCGAAEAAGISRQAVYDCQRADPEFAMRCLDALQDAADIVLAHIMHRAIQGEPVPVYRRGRLVDYKFRASDTLLIYVHQLLRRQCDRTLQRTQAQPEPPAAVPPPRPPVELVAASRDNTDRPLNDRPTTGPVHAA